MVHDTKMRFWPFKSAVEKHVDMAYEEQIFEQVAREVHANEIRPGLWAKALSECEGDLTKAKAKYIALRASSLMNEVAAGSELARQTGGIRQTNSESCRAIRCPGCNVELRLHKQGDMVCRCPSCKTTFCLDETNNIYDIGCNWD